MKFILLLCALAALLPVIATAQEARSTKWVNLRAGPARDYPLVARLGVSAKVILTPIDEVKLTPLGKDGGFFEVADVDSGADSGDTGDGKTGRSGQSDRTRAGVFAQYGAAVFA